MNFLLNIRFLALFFYLLLALTALLYWPGLNGMYLLDDEANLDFLTYIDEQATEDNLGKFVSEGVAGPLGRPLSLLSLAWQYIYYPQDPWMFKFVNLMLHLLNGCLVFWLAYLLNRLLKIPDLQAAFYALFVAAVWLLHPLQISTTLYVIQRMTQLATFFMLLGMIGYVYGRWALTQQRLKTGFLWVSLGVGLGGILAIFSKEIGVLLIFYVLVIEKTLFQHLPRPPNWGIWLSIFLYIPILLFVGYLIFAFESFVHGYVLRAFDMTERVLTQFRILVEYLGKITLLYPRDFGLFHDDFVFSQGIFQPISTFFAILTIVGLLLSAILLRKRYPLFAFPILFFFAGHLLESTIIPLVLYFEHRNYLPLFGVIFGLSLALRTVWLKWREQRKFVLGLTGVWLVFLILISWNQIQLWANPLVQAIVWAQDKPKSPYAQSHLASILLRIGEVEKATQVYQKMVVNLPDQNGPYLLWLSAACLQEKMAAPDLDAVYRSLAEDRLDSGTLSSMQMFAENLNQQKCVVDNEVIERFFEILLNNPKNRFHHYRHKLYHYYSFFWAQQDKFDKALEAINRALSITKGEPILYLKRVHWALENGEVEAAADYLQQARLNLSALSEYLYAKELDYLTIIVEFRQNIRKMQNAG